MVKVYNSIKDEHGNLIAGVTKLFIISTQSDHTIGKFISGIACVPEGNGTMFIVDEWIINQVDKVQFKDGALFVKYGEELIPPVKTEKQLRMEELQRRMAELQAMPDEPTDTEEQTDTPLLDYIDEPAE